MTGGVDPGDRIDLRSDTVTRPSPAMREAAATASVGDDVLGEDPTVADLEARAARLVGTEAALFVPSGTMGNQVAAATHTEPGEEVVVERESHVYVYELGGLARHSGLQTRTVDAGPRGELAPEALGSAIVEADDHRPGTGLVCLENTHNRYGGTAIEPAALEAAAAVAREAGVAVHLDGARIANAAVALGVAVEELAEPADTVMFCLSKGLGAPVGSVLAGPAGFVERARRVRKAFGGGMRQAGVVAASGLLALDNVDRLATDHANARALAAGLGGLDGIEADEPETNIVLVRTVAAGESARDLLDDCADVGVLGVPFGEDVVRFCTHLDVDAADVEEAVDRIARTR